MYIYTIPLYLHTVNNNRTIKLLHILFDICNKCDTMNAGGDLMNRELLEKKMLEYGDSQAELSRVLGISKNSMSKKFTGKVYFKMFEIMAITKRYKLSGGEVIRIFLQESEV